MDLIQILDSDLNQLNACRGSPCSTPEVDSYRAILIAYLAKDIPELTRQMKAAEAFARVYSNESSAAPIVANLARLRLQILMDAVDIRLVKLLESSTELAPAWTGEIYFVLANALLTLKQMDRFRRYSVLAAQALGGMGARHKALRAWVNAKSAMPQSREKPMRLRLQKPASQMRFKTVSFPKPFSALRAESNNRFSPL